MWIPTNWHKNSIINIYSPVGKEMILTLSRIHLLWSVLKTYSTTGVTSTFLAAKSWPGIGILWASCRKKMLNADYDFTEISGIWLIETSFQWQKISNGHYPIKELQANFRKTFFKQLNMHNEHLMNHIIIIIIISQTYFRNYIISPW